MILEFQYLLEKFTTILEWGRVSFISAIVIDIFCLILICIFLSLPMFDLIATVESFVKETCVLNYKFYPW